MEERKIRFERLAILGQGGYGTVYRGEYEGRPVAVKRIILDKNYKVGEEEALKKLDHPNIIKLLHCESDEDFRYCAMELCVASLDKLFLKEDDPDKYKGPMPRHIEVFLQLALGLEYIHSNNFVHRDIKPENILISVQSAGPKDEITIKWADFGLSKTVNERGTFTMRSGIQGTTLWFAPELLKSLKKGINARGTVKSDVFALALVFGFLFLKGEHLYGSEEENETIKNIVGRDPINLQKIRDNIINKSPINMHQIDVKLREFYEDELLGKMLEDEPSQRISAAQVVRQLESINENLSRKEQELRKVCAEYTEFDLAGKIKDLIRYGIDVNAKDEEGWNALHHLCRHQSRSNLIDAIRPLTESGIDVKAKGKDGSNVLHYLARHVPCKDFLFIMNYLLESGMDVFAKDNDGHIPFFYVNEGNNSTQRMEISYDRNAVLGEGGFGCVFKGTYYDKEVAVKRVQLNKVNETEELAMLKLDHQNIMKLIHCESDKTFRYYALELCVASLDKLFLKEDNPKKYKGPMPRHIEAFLQLALGLEHIHSMKLIHRDIKPENILISKTTTSKSMSVTLKWAGFGLSHPVNERGTFTMDKIRGTETWVAPEILKLLRDNKKGRGTISSDVFALGLVFGYLFLDGKHLYGSNMIEISLNINGRNAVNMKDIDSIILEYYENNLLERMLADIPGRMTSTEVVDELNSIKDKFIEKEEELRRLFAGYFSLDRKKKIKELIRLGIDLNAKNKNGRNVLQYLCYNNSDSTLIDAIEFLIENKIDVNAKDKQGRNALHLLCVNNSTPKITDAIEKLKKSGFNGNAKDNEGLNALHLLCGFSSNTNLTDAIEELKKSGIEVKAKDNRGRNALHLLCLNNSNPKLSDAIEKLKQSGIDVNAKDIQGRNALHLLCYNNSNPALSDAIEKLKRSGIDINAKNNVGSNALHLLCGNSSNLKFTDAIIKLIQSGIDVKAKDNMGWNAPQLLGLNPNLTDAIKKLAITKLAIIEIMSETRASTDKRRNEEKHPEGQLKKRMTNLPE